MNVGEANIMVLEFITTHCRLVETMKFGTPKGQDLFMIGLFRKLLQEAKP